MSFKDVTDEFCHAPEQFMQNNVVMQWIQHEKDELINVGVKQIEGATVDNKTGGRACFFYQKDDTPSLPVYWCPYNQNKLRSAWLGNDALFALTVAVTGCSVGIGSGEKGQQMMCHVNSAEIGSDWKPYGDAVAGARQAEAQDAQLRYKLGPGATIASPVAYRAASKETKVTFFAVHGLSQPWQLYGLSYRDLGGKRYFHGGVKSY